jgi:alkylation response protein AidB-like acyl-CoA dehydrogenase
MKAPITYPKDDKVFELAHEAAAIAAAHAAATDRAAAFPDEGLQALRDKGLMGLIVPKDCGGFGASYVTAIEVAQILGAACLSTSMLWSMHCQHVAVIDDYAPEPLRSEVLRRIAAGKLLLASVTTEPSKGGHIMSALSSLTPDGEGQLIDREAPVVTGGLQSDGFLISLRRSPDATPSEVVFVYAERSELELKVTGVWDTVGMRGTVSLPMHIKGRVPAGRILEPEGGFPRLSATTLVPAGHILWAASWLGAAKGAYHQLMHILRTPELRQGFPLKSDLFSERIARIRLDIDLAEAFLLSVNADFETLRREHGIELEPFEDYRFCLRINEVKIAVSERLFQAIDAMVQVGGLRYGYRVRSDSNIDRTFRDLRSASLMFSNDRLLVSNGKLALLGAK